LIPLYLEDDLIGSFSVHSKRQRSYLHGEIELAQALVQQAGLAIQWARTAEQSRQAAVLEERNRLAREIHDNLAQSFTGILIQLGVAQRIATSSPEDAWGLIERVRVLAVEGLAEARRSVWALQPNSQEYTDLAITLQGHIDRILSNGTIQGIVHIHGKARVLASDVGLNLLRIAQEAVNNAVQHSHAQQVFVELTFGESQVKLFVQDNGQGFDAQHQDNGGGFGLTGMRQRAERIGGHLTIVSSPGAGTEVAVTAPIPAMPVGGQDTQ
jgi:signal transduction histidine kinase